MRMGNMGPAPKPEAERFWPKVNLDGPGGCWLWTGWLRSGGYGGFAVGSEVDGTARGVSAHRWAYEHLVGSIPDGLQIDHLCRVRACVNPSHLEPVTLAENVARGDSGAHNRVKTCCPHGHTYDEANTWTDSRGRRSCRACNRDKQRARRAQRLAGV